MRSAARRVQASVVRQKGGVVAWVLLTVADAMDGPSKWPIYHDYFFTDAKMKAHKDGLTEGSEGHALYPDLALEDGDIISRTSRFSAFIQGARERPVCRDGHQHVLRILGPGCHDDRVSRRDGS